MKNCPPSKVEVYTGAKFPTCNNGKGCKACLDKWYMRNHFGRGRGMTARTGISFG